MKLFACMCNQPQRLSAALTPVRAVLLAQPPVRRWGLAYAQGGDVLLVRTPTIVASASAKPIDLAGPLAEISTDCAVGQAVNDERYSGTDNTPPFRFRRWMFAMSNQPDLDAATPRLIEHVPEYLRRNLRGRTPGELVFHVFLAMLHDEGSVDEPNLPVQHTRRALSATIRLVSSEMQRAGVAEGAPPRVTDPAGPGTSPATAGAAALGNIIVSNGRSMIVAHSDTPLRLRRLWVLDDKGSRDDSFLGVLLVSGGDGDPKDGFEDVPNGAVMISRDLQVQFAGLEP